MTRNRDVNSMPNPTFKNPAYEALTDQQLAEIDALCDRFDLELTHGNSPCLENFLMEVPVPARDALFAELLAMDLEYRRKNNENPQREEYQQRFPLLQQAIGLDFEKAAQSMPPKHESHDGIGDNCLVATESRPVLENVQLIEVIGRGGMGVVWRADQVRPVRRRVALKLIKSELQSKEVLARFDAEKQTLAMMDHPNIARVLDAGTTPDGRPYFVMELVAGIPITRYCDDNKLSVDERLKLFVSVCQAVQHAHQKGIIHRDLKPSNVLVADIDGEAVPKVIDFGLAKVVEQNRSLTDMTMETEFGKVVGTVQYMSPEQAGLERTVESDIDTRTDVYSLGVVLYELLTGSTPLEKELLGQKALLEVLKAIRDDDPPRPSSRLRSSSPDLNSTVSCLRRQHPARLLKILQGELDCVVMKALEKDRCHRYQSANDFAKDLSNFLTGEAVSARPPSTWYQIKKFARRNRGLVAALLAIASVLLIGIAGTTYGMFQAIQKTKLAEEKTIEAQTERRKAEASERVALREKANAESNERRAVNAEETASAEAQRARDAEATAKFQLAVARYNDHRAVEARTLLHQIPTEYRDNFEWHYCNRRFQGSDVCCYGHTNHVYEVGFSPNGDLAISVCKSGTVRVWDAVTGQQLRTIDGHEGKVSGLAVFPDGPLFATGGSDKVVRISNSESGETIRTLNGHSEAINGLAISRDGNQIASASDDKTVKVWNTKTGEELFTITGHTGKVLGVAFDRNGERLASTSSEDRTIRICDAQSGSSIHVIEADRPEIRRLAFSPDGKQLAGICYGRYLLWDTQTWELIADVVAHDRIVHCLAYSPDGSRLATAGDTSEIKLWDTRTGNLVSTLSGHAQAVWGIAFNLDGTRLVSGSTDQTVRIWNTMGGNDLTVRDHSTNVFSVTFSFDGQQLATADFQGRIILRNATTGEPRFRLLGHSEGIGELSFSPDGQRLASASDDKTVRIWSTATGEELAILHGHKSPVLGVAFSPCNRVIASSSRDGTIKLWDAQTYQETATLVGHRGTVYDIDFSPDGLYIASAGFDKTVKLWDVQTQRELRTFTGNTALVRTVAFDPSGQRLISAGYCTKIRVWDVATGQQIAAANRSSGAIFRVAVSHDGKRVATASTDHAVHLLDASTGHEIITPFSRQRWDVWSCLYPGWHAARSSCWGRDRQDLGCSPRTRNSSPQWTFGSSYHSDF